MVISSVEQIHRIRTYWAERGYSVTLNRESIQSWALKGDMALGVRSDMVNGLPKDHPANRGK